MKHDMDAFPAFQAHKHKRKLALYVFSAVLFFTLLGNITYEATKAKITFLKAGDQTVVRTHAETVGDLMDELHVDVGQYDKLVPDPNTNLKPGMKVIYDPAKKVTVTIGEQNKDYFTTAATVDEFIKKQQIPIDPRDDVIPGKQEPIKNNMNIRIHKAFQITLNDGGEEQQIWTTAATVGEFLKKQDITLSKLDKVSPEQTTPLDAHQSIKITRVEKVMDIVEEPIDYPVVTRKDDTLPQGQKKVLKEGKKGRVVKHYEVTLEDGKEVERKLLKEQVEQESEKRIVAVGTKPIQQTISRSDDGKVTREFYVTATAYTANCTGCSGVTYTGINLLNEVNKANPKKVIAVDPKVIPLGSKVWVEGYGYAIAGDIGSAIKGDRIDLFMPKERDANRYGKKRVKIKVYGK